MTQGFFIALMCFLWTADVAANAGWREFIAGDYAAARTTGRSAETAEGYSVACRSSLVIGGFLKQDRTATHNLHEAIDDCSQALELDPNHFHAHMSLAIALSFEGKRTKKVFYPGHARILLEDLIAKHPDNAVAYGALAAWHSQVSAAGLFARITLKASRKQARQLFELAFEKGAIDFPLMVEHLKFLAVGSKSDREEAILVAKRLIEQPQTSEFDKLLQRRCLAILAALETGKKRKVKKAVKKASPFHQAKGWQKPKAYPKNKVSFGLQS